MATLTSFEDLECWKTAKYLTVQIYASCSSLRDFGFRDQIQRAAVSIMNNIAEGFGRVNTKEKLQFINIAVGSAQEVKSMLFLALDLHYMSEQHMSALLQEVQKVIETTQGFRRYLKTLISE